MQQKHFLLLLKAESWLVLQWLETVPVRGTVSPARLILWFGFRRSAEGTGTHLPVMGTKMSGKLKIMEHGSPIILVWVHTWLEQGSLQPLRAEISPSGAWGSIWDSGNPTRLVVCKANSLLVCCALWPKAGLILRLGFVKQGEINKGYKIGMLENTLDISEEK